MAKKEQEKSTGKCVKMKFSKPMFYNDMDKPLYEAGKVYDVPEEMVARWVKRGGDIVGNETKTVSAAEPETKVEAPTLVGQEELEPTTKPDEDKKEDEKLPSHGNRGGRGSR